MGRRLLPLYNWNDFCLPRQKTCPFLILCFELQVWKVLRFIIFMQKECPIPQPLISESVTVGNQSIWTFTIMDQLILIWHHRHSQFSLSYFRTRSHRILVHSQPKCIPSHIYEPVTDPVSTKKTINLWCPSSLKLSFFRKKNHHKVTLQPKLEILNNLQDAYLNMTSEVNISPTQSRKFYHMNNTFRNTVFGPPAVAERVPWNRVCPSFCPSFRLCGRFLGIASLVFSKFWHGARNPYEVVRDRAEFSRKNFFAPRIGKMDQTQGFF